MTLSVTYDNFAGLLRGETRDGVERDYVTDTLGSLVGTVDSSGNLDYRAEYWPHGEEIVTSGTNLSPWGFVGLQGYYRDVAGKLAYVRSRFYDFRGAQWMSKDPLWPNFAPYSYVRLDPLSTVDPSGLGPNFGSGIIGIIGIAGQNAFGDVCTYLGPDTYPSDIVACAEEAARKQGVTCSFTEQQIKCMAGYCGADRQYVRVSIGTSAECLKEDPNACAITESLGKFCEIKLCLANLGKPGCRVGGLNRVIAHELSHSCGVDHGTKGGDEPPSGIQCNDFISYCLLGIGIRSSCS